MNRLCRVRAIAVLVAGSLLLAGPARASHFRFATLSWRPKPGGPANTVQFTVQEGWRRSAFIGTPSGGPPIVGDTIFADGELDFGDGSESVPIEILVTSVNEDQDWFSGTTQTPIEHTYPAPNDEGQPWLASVDSCCRIDSLQNNAGGSFHFETTVDLAAPPHAPNGSPITTELPIVGVPPNAVASFFVPAVDPDRDALTWRLSTSQEAAGVEELFVQPPDLAVAAETGKVSWNTTGHSCGQLPPGAPCLWSLAITIQDGSTKIPLDFIVSVTRNTIGHPPVFDVPPTPANNSTVHDVNGTFTFAVRASDADAGDTVTIQESGLPAGATLSEASGTNPVSRVFSWTPGPDDAVNANVCFQAHDQTGGTSDLLCVNLVGGNPCGGENPAGRPCDDDNPCTGNDVCDANGGCAGTPITCAPIDACHGAGTCDPATGCTNPPEPDGTACGNGNVCDGEETCHAGICRAPSGVEALTCQEAALVAFVTEFDDGAIAPVEAPTQTVGGAIPVGSGPWGVAVHPAGTEVWATNRTGSSVGVIDAVTRRVTATVTVGDTPLGVAVRPDGQRAYVANFGGGTVTVIDTATHAAVGTIRVGDGPSGLAFNPAGTRLYVSNYRSDTVSVVDTAAGTVVATVPVGARPLGLAVDAVRSRLYVANYGSDDVSVVGTFSNTVLTTVAVGAKPFGVAADGAHGRVYVTNAASDTVSIIDTGVNAVVGTVSVGRAPFGVDVDPTGQRVWVANAGGNTLSVLDTAAPAVAATVPVGRLPIALGRFLAVVGDCPAASLGGCDDADPFTIDTCVPQSGCEHATHGAGDGLFAGLGALADALDASIEPDLGGSKAANLLKQLIDQARGFLGTPLARAADVLTPLDHPGVKTSRATRKRLRRVDRALERFIRLVAKGLRRNTLQRDVGWRLLDLARAADQSVHAALGRKTPVPSARRAGSPVPHPNAVAPTRLPPPFGRTPSGDLAL